MRKLIINDVAFDMTLPEKIEKTALAGWDGMFTGWDREKGNKHIAALIKDAGLIYQSIHAPFEHCDRLWEKDRVADDEEAMLTKVFAGRVGRRRRHSGHARHNRHGQKYSQRDGSRSGFIALPKKRCISA